jgi:site-specific DNA recombinase
MLIEEEFRKDGVLVEYVIGQYDDSDEGRLQKQIRASIAEYEKAKILERSKRGKRGKAKSGYVIVGARPPYGYKVRSEPHKAWLEIDEAEAQVVRMIFDWYVNGDEYGKPISLHNILCKLMALGIPTRGDREKHVAKKRGVGVWSDAMIRHILKNETYTGTWYYGKIKMINDGNESVRKPKPKCGFGKQVPRPEEEWIAVSVPEVISREMFDKVQERLQMNLEQAKRNTKREYLMARGLRCATCGYTFVGRTRTERNRYYYCNGTRRMPRVCNTPAFRVDDLDNTIWGWVRALLEDPENIRAGLQGMQEEAERANQSLYDRLEIIQNRIEENQRQLQKLLDLYLNDDFPREMLQERRACLEETLMKLRQENVELSSHLHAITVTDEQIEDIESICAQVRDGLDTATFEQKRQLIDMLDVRGKLAIENDEKVVYVKCILGQQLLSVARTSPWQSNHKGQPIMINARLVVRGNRTLSPIQCL